MKENYNSRKYFAARFKTNSSRSVVWVYLCRFMQKWVPKRGSVLDIGAGYCDFVNNIKAKDRHALDMNPDLHKHVAKGVKAHIGDCRNLAKFKNSSMDVVFASNLFEHLELEDIKKSLKEVHRVLKKGGKLIILQPNFKYCYKEFYDDYTHVSALTHLSMQDILALEDFNVIKTYPRFVPFSLKTGPYKYIGIKFFSFLIPLYLHSPIRPMAGSFLMVAEK